VEATIGELPDSVPKLVSTAFFGNHCLSEERAAVEELYQDSVLLTRNEIIRETTDVGLRRLWGPLAAALRTGTEASIDLIPRRCVY
jgi:hypothetical protein